MERLRTLTQTFQKFATNHVEEPDVPAVADGDDGYDKSTKIALLLLKEEVNKPLRQFEDYLNEMPGILDVFDLKKSPDYTSFSVWDGEFPMQELRRLLRVSAEQAGPSGTASIDASGFQRDQPSRSCGLSTCGRRAYAEDKPPVFVLADRGSGERYVIPAKAATESTIRLLLADRQQESLTVYTDGFRAYESLEEDDAFTREYVVHGDSEYVDGDVHVNTCESHASLARRWLSPHQGVSKDRLTPYFRAFQLCREVFRNPGEEVLKTILKTAL